MTVEFQSPPLNLQRVMAKLYRSGIGCGVEAVRENGFTVWLGFAEEATAILHTHSLEEATAWLDRAARRHYPRSAYATSRS
jgi:hypothetical protein